MKYFPTKKNGDLRKTPIYGETLLELYSEIKNYYGPSFYAQYEYLTNTDDEIDEYAVVGEEKLSPKEFFRKVKLKIDLLNTKRQEEINTLYDSRQKQLQEKIEKANFTEEELKLFHLLYGNLEVEVYQQSMYDDRLYCEPFFKGISLKKITVKKSEVSRMYTFP